MGRRLAFFAVVFFGCNGRGCGLPNTDDEQIIDTSERETGATDTDPVGPCAVPEIEPNGSEAQAQLLPLESQGCGSFVGDLDLDYWLIDFEQDGWLSVELEARSIGSLADPGLLLTSEGGMSAHVGDSTSGEDIRLIFPSGPERYHALVAELQAGQGGENHDYEIMASWAKAPISWNRDEVEPNDVFGAGQVVEDGDLLFGWLNSSIDSDWYQIELAAGKQTVILDLDAWEFGSAGDFKLILYNEAQESLGTWYSGEVGWELDPYVEITVPGNQILSLRVAEQRERFSALCWYVLDVKVESEE